MADKQDLGPLLDSQHNTLGLIFEDGNGIDAKALAVLAANVAIIIFIAQSSLADTGLLYILLYGPFVTSLAFDIASVWPRRYLTGMVDLDARPEYLGMERDELVLQLLTDTQYAARHNSALNRKRLRYCAVSIIITGLGFAILLAII